MVADQSTSSNALTRSPALLIPGGLAVLVVGLLVFLAGVQTWLGAGRSTDFVFPASLLNPQPNPRVTLVVGVVISLAGLVAAAVGAYRLACAVDAAAAAAHSRLPSPARRVAPSAQHFTVGILAVPAGLALYQAGSLGQYLLRGRLGSPWPLESLGAVVTLVGFGLLLRGIYRLVGNIQVSAAAAAGSSVPAAA